MGLIIPKGDNSPPPHRPSRSLGLLPPGGSFAACWIPLRIQGGGEGGTGNLPTRGRSLRGMGNYAHTRWNWAYVRFHCHIPMPRLGRCRDKTPLHRKGGTRHLAVFTAGNTHAIPEYHWMLWHKPWIRLLTRCSNACSLGQNSPSLIKKGHALHSSA